MPVRSLTSSVIRWPDRQEINSAVHQWARAAAARHSGVVRIGYFGSYARGDWGVGSDVDLIIIVSTARQPFAERARDWDTTDLPVPADVLIYTEDEWTDMSRQNRRITRETIDWVYEAPPQRSPR